MTNDEHSRAQERVPEPGRRWADAKRRRDAEALGPLPAGDFVTQVAVRQDGSWLAAGIHLSSIAHWSEGR